MSILQPEPYWGWRCSAGARSNGAWPDRARAEERAQDHQEAHAKRRLEPCMVEVIVVFESHGVQR